MTYIPYKTNSSKGAPVQNAFAQTFKDLGYPTTMKQELTDKKSEVREQERKLELIKEDADETIQKAKFAEELIEHFKNTNSGEREKAYFEKMLDLKYENECLKRENEVLKAENRSLKVKLEKAYDFMRQFTINGMSMLEYRELIILHFERKFWCLYSNSKLFMRVREIENDIEKSKSI